MVVTITEYVCDDTKGDFKALSVSITNISCQRSIPVDYNDGRDQAISVQLKKHVLKHVFAILMTYMETRL